MLQVGAHEDQAAGAALTVGGTDPGLGAPDLFLQVGALASLGILKLFFFAFSSWFRASCRFSSCWSSSCGSIASDGSIGPVDGSNWIVCGPGLEIPIKERAHYSRFTL